VLGLDGGQAYNLTQDRMVFPGGVGAAAIYREDQGLNSYLAVTNSGGGPAANARIGDYVSAEVVRNFATAPSPRNVAAFGDSADAEIA
jgi:hypothetical protein